MLLKRPMKASAFASSGHLAPIQRHTNTMLIHTRAATTGLPSDNDNNHPIVVQARDHHPGLVGIHNGVLWNHEDIWKTHPDLADERVGEVDSQVIFQILSRMGRDKLDLLDGDASIAWVEMDQPNELNVARMGGRPLAATITPGGSFIFASTGDALLEALGYFSVLGKFHKHDVTDFAEGDWVTLDNGEIIASGNDFPVIALAKSYTYGGYTKPGKAKGTSPYRPTHQATWYDEWDDDTWNTPRHEQQVTQTAGGALLPFEMSEADKAIWERSMEEAADPGGEPFSEPSAEDLTSFDCELFHFLTRGAFLGTDVDDEVIAALVELAYSKGDEGRMDTLLNAFITPLTAYDQQLAHDIALSVRRKD